LLLTDDAIQGQISQRFAHPGLQIEGLRLQKTRAYTERVGRERQWWLSFFRRAGTSNRINNEAVDSYVRQVTVESSNWRRLLLPLGLLGVAILRRSKAARRRLVSLQTRFSPDLYSDLFENLPPDLVVASTPGWRQDCYLLREAARRKIKTAAAIVGWDNPSSYSLPGSPVDWITCWSQIQEQELVLGSDWTPDRVNVGGIPSYDGYFRREWLIPCESYFALHGLDPARKLVSYACSFISFAPNLVNAQTLANLISADALSQPAQLLIRLHPNHYQNNPLYRKEADQMRQMAQEMPHIHIVEPVPLGGDLGYYSGEDMPEKTSMMAYSDVFTTVYSTMVVEAAIHDRPIISVCIDTPGGWKTPRKFSLPLSKIGSWPTHQRFRLSGAGRVVSSELTLKEALNYYLDNPGADQDKRSAFIQRECTFTDGSAGHRTGEFFLSLLDK
jgi:hypothetical protein